MSRECNSELESELPAGTPNWITPRLVKLTLKIWQPRYKTLLTREDAITMLAGVGRLFDLLSRGARHEAVCGVSTRK